MSPAVSVGLAVFLTIAMYPAMRALTRRWRLERENFRGKRIPTGFGFLLVLTAVPVYAAGVCAGQSQQLVLLAVVVGFGALGLLDDIYGTREVGGFRGHLGLLLKGRVSTGLAKAIGGGILGLALGFVAAGFDPVVGILNGLLISLAANTLNLLDLRPGRAVSCFWIGILALAITPLGRSVYPDLIPVLIPVVLLTALDRSARVMLGDAGSNVLGAVLGLSIMIGFEPVVRLVLVVLMLAVHLYAERYSISKLIESNRVLHQIDRLLGDR